MKKVLILLPLLFLLSGCYNYRELNDIAIVTAIGISMEDDEYRISLQVVNPKKEQDTSNSNEPEFIIYNEQNKSLQEAFRIIVRESPKKVYGTHLQILVIDESVAKDSVSELLDFLAREPEMRSEFYILVGKNEDILNVLTPLDNISSQNIVDSLDSSSRFLGYDNLVTFNDFISDYQNENKELAVPSIEVIGNVEEGFSKENLETTHNETSITLSNIAVFKDNKLKGYLSKEESLAYNFIMDNITNAIIVNDFSKDEFIATEIVSSSTKMEAKPQKNKITINIKGKASVTELNYDIDLTKEKNIKKVQKELNKNVEELIKNSIASINKKYNSDIYGFKDLYYKTDPKYFKKIKDVWYDEIFNNIEIEVNSNIKIVEQGTLLGGLKHE